MEIRRVAGGTWECTDNQIFRPRILTIHLYLFPLDFSETNRLLRIVSIDKQLEDRMASTMSEVPGRAGRKNYCDVLHRLSTFR
jgi:hypothetical protein